MGGGKGKKEEYDGSWEHNVPKSTVCIHLRVSWRFSDHLPFACTYMYTHI